MKLTSTLFLIFVSLVLKAQDDSKKLFSVKTRAEIVTVDVLGNIYTVTGSEIKKYDLTGNLCCSFSDRDYGSITSIDTRDPLRIVIFYRSFGIIRLLDNQLTQQSVIDLRTLNIANPLLVCSSEAQGLWVYDQSTSRLYKFNSQLQAIGLSNNLSNDVPFAIDPLAMSESDYWLVINNKTSLLVFDKMGNYFKPIPVKNSYGQLIRDEWVYCSDKKIEKLNIRSGLETETLLPVSAEGYKIVIAPQLFVRYNENTLEVFNH